MKISLKSTLIAAAAAIMGMAAAPASAAIIVSGDANIGNGIDNSVGAPTNANGQFFQQILGTGTNVVVLGPSSSISGSGAFSFGASATAINTFYDNLAGVTSTLVNDSGAVTAGLLSGVNLLVAVIPDAFSAAEISVLANFMNSGGSVFFLGDNSNFAATNTAINSALSALGSSLSIQNDIMNPAWTYAFSAGDTFAAGIPSFVYNAASRVAGGSAAFRTAAGDVFVAVDRPLDTPLPGAVWLFLAGIAGLTVANRKQKHA